MSTKRVFLPPQSPQCLRQLAWTSGIEQSWWPWSHHSATSLHSSTVTLMTIIIILIVELEWDSHKVIEREGGHVLFHLVPFLHIPLPLHTPLQHWSSELHGSPNGSPHLFSTGHSVRLPKEHSSDSTHFPPLGIFPLPFGAKYDVILNYGFTVIAIYRQKLFFWCNVWHYLQFVLLSQNISSSGFPLQYSPSFLGAGSLPGIGETKTKVIFFLFSMSLIYSFWCFVK